MSDKDDNHKIEINPATVLHHAEVKIAELEARAEAGEDVSGPLTWHLGLRERMQARLAEVGGRSSLVSGSSS